MGRRLAFITLIALAGIFVPTSRTAALAARAKVVVMPREGHAGDTLYLSGSGFPPNRALTATFQCRGIYGYRPSDRGLRTDVDGQFLAYSGLRLRGVKPGDCLIRVSAGRASASSATAASATYTILPSTRPLSRCDTHICLQVKAILVRLSSGVQGNIAIEGWPGAWADVTVTSPHGGAQHRRVRLHWQGSATVQLLVAPGLNQGLKARVYVRARLGAVSGSGSQRFILIPGGR